MISNKKQAVDRDVKGLVLAGTHRWNPTSFEAACPRPLMCVADTPVLSYTLRWLCTGRIRQVTICANQGSQSIRRCFADGAQLGMAIDYYEDCIPRGPAGCVRDASTRSKVRTFVVAEGTAIPRVSLERLLDAHRRSGAVLTVVVEQDKGHGNGSQQPMSPSGVYVFDLEVMRHIREMGYQDIKEGLIPRLFEAGEKIETYMADEPSLRVADPDSYLRANEWALGRICRPSESVPQYRRWDESLVHVSASVADDVRLIGPVLIGPRTEVANDVTIVGPTSIGSDCTVEPGTTICRSAVWDRCRIGRGSFVDQCIVTTEVSLERGARVCRVARVRARPKMGMGTRRPLRTRVEKANVPRAEIIPSPSYTVISRPELVAVGRQMTAKLTKS